MKRKKLLYLLFGSTFIPFAIVLFLSVFMNHIIDNNLISALLISFGLGIIGLPIIIMNIFPRNHHVDKYTIRINIFAIRKTCLEIKERLEKNYLKKNFLINKFNDGICPKCELRIEKDWDSCPRCKLNFDFKNRSSD